MLDPRFVMQTFYDGSTNYEVRDNMGANFGFMTIPIPGVRYNCKLHDVFYHNNSKMFAFLN